MSGHRTQARAGRTGRAAGGGYSTVRLAYLELFTRLGTKWAAFIIGMTFGVTCVEMMQVDTNGMERLVVLHRWHHALPVCLPGIGERLGWFAKVLEEFGFPDAKRNRLDT